MSNRFFLFFLYVNLWSVIFTHLFLHRFVLVCFSVQCVTMSHPVYIFINISVNICVKISSRGNLICKFGNGSKKRGEEGSFSLGFESVKGCVSCR